MYPVDLHMHTVVSTHVYSTLSDYIAQARQKGTKLFMTIDHGPGMGDAPHHWHSTNMRIWPRVVSGVGILRSVEANIKNADGEVDCSGKMFDPLDLIIAGFHEPVLAPHDKATNTQMIIVTTASGNVHIIGHPGDPKYKIDVKAVVEAAVKHQVALEINNSSFLHSHKGSEDSCREVAAAVRNAGGWVVLDSDSHIAFTMGEFEECLKILDVVDFPPERILNVSSRRSLNFLESRGTVSIAEFTDL